MTDTNLSLVLDELENAKRKHPHFIDRVTCLSDATADAHLELMRNHLHSSIEANNCDMFAVLLCEFCEAMQAYAHGDLDHARQELAQCAAVCIRGMEYIENEIHKQENDTNEGHD